MEPYVFSMSELSRLSLTETRWEGLWSKKQGRKGLEVGEVVEEDEVGVAILEGEIETWVVSREKL